MSTEQAVEKAKLSVRNIGGIDDTSVTFTPGVTVLAGENATNRTSLLQAIMAALGSDNVSMKGDADSASVEMAIDGEAYARAFARQGNTVIADGEPYLDDPTLAELFAFLLESNEARRAVATNDDLRDLIMRPVDTDEIQRRIERRVRKRSEIETELEELNGLKDRLPALEEERTRLEAAIGEAKSGLADTEAELEARDANVEQTREGKAELEERLADLRSKRSELEDIRYELDTERESLDAARTRKRELEAESKELPETPMGEIEERKARIEGLREQKRGLESEINEVQSVIRFNQDMLDGDDGGLLDALEPPADDGDGGDDGGELTDELLPDETVTCWTCGSDVPHEQIETTVTRLQELSQRKLGEINDIEDRLDDLTDEVRTLEEQQRRRERLHRQRSTLEAELADSESAIERLTDRRETLQAEIEALEAEIESLEDDSYEEILDIHKEANQYEYELGRLEGDLEDLEAEITRIDGRLDAESELRQRREELTAEIGDLRTRIDRIEKQAIEGFNDHMESVLGILGYSNLERIWLERVEREVREGRRKVTKSAFELHIVRQTDSGVTYEDTIDHLSESEREVTGLVFALAGYLAHEVYETVPFMLLDSLEAIDSERIAALVEYVEGFSEYLVVALLPEDAAALSEEYPRISDI